MAHWLCITRPEVFAFLDFSRAYRSLRFENFPC